ncbi:TPA: hypothetical protein DDW35_06665, partial [Candidatus Sumerlaeota bacterium]|nr:hypothetical protein [Candidatus Sumerlaeota bacterium]
VRVLYEAENGMQGLEVFREHRPDVVVTDINMPVMNGLDMARAIKALSRQTQIIVTTAYSDTDYLMQAIEIGVDRYVIKPVDQQKLMEALRECVKVTFLEREVQRHQEEREKLIVNLRSAMAQVKQLNGLLPICACCKKIRDDKGNWTQLESYIRKHSQAEFTHSYCPDCAQQMLSGGNQKNVDGV